LRRDLPDVRPFADVVALVAFGPAKMAIGLSDIDEHAAQLRAGIAIMNAAIEGTIKLVGTACAPTNEERNYPSTRSNCKYDSL
jgi:hypothetical protein